MGITSRLLYQLRLSLPAGVVAVGSLLAAVSAAAQSVDPPSRVARFEANEGSVQFQPATGAAPMPADPRWPLAAGDRVFTGVGSRAELHVGDATVRLGDSSNLAFTTLDERMAQIRLDAGTVALVVRELQQGDRVEIDTPNLALVIDRPGRWRLDVDPGRNTTRVTAEQGVGTLYGENGQPSVFAAPRSRDFAFRSLAESAPLPIRVADSFDRWSADRDRLAAQSPSLRYASADIPGVAQLDAYGDWGNDERYGAIWYPRSTGTDWAPYRDGRWQWIEPWGWTWIDDAPWGFAPFHYGRWTQAGNRWGWVPGPRQGRPAYAPAVVGFVGGIPPGAGSQAGVGWFPLAPGERWKPPFPASPAYIARLNRAGFTQDNTNGYYYQTRPGAVTMVPGDDFGRHGFNGARPRIPTPDQLAVFRPMTAPSGPGQGRFNPQTQAQPQPMMQPLPATAPLADRVRQDQWERDQRTRQDQHQADMLRQQQTREAQQRFQPSYGQREQQFQREQVERQQQQLMQQQFQQQQFQQRQQHEQIFQQQRQQQQQQQGLMQQQQRQQQQQMDQQRQIQGEQQRQAQQQQAQQQQIQQQQQRQQQQQVQQMQQIPQPMMRPGGGMQRSQPGEPQQHGGRQWPGQQQGRP